VSCVPDSPPAVYPSVFKPESREQFYSVFVRRPAISPLTEVAHCVSVVQIHPKRCRPAPSCMACRSALRMGWLTESSLDPSRFHQQEETRENYGLLALWPADCLCGQAFSIPISFPRRLETCSKRDDGNRGGADKKRTNQMVSDAEPP